MMTEDEAKTKFCPMMRAVRGDGVSCFNVGTDCRPDVACRCIGSACMMWRGVGRIRQSIDTNEVQRWKSVGWQVVEAGTEKTLMDAGERGYCGLAGRPE